jgi:tRNA-2-methylthio-N6-dimethylallyladenosine synthase
MLDLLAEHGYQSADDPREADLILLNTCTIREKAEQKVYSLLGRLLPLKDKKPGLIIGVCGCVAQQQGAKLLERAPGLDLVVGTHGFNRLPELVAEVRETGHPICYTDFNYDLRRLADPDGREIRSRLFLSILQVATTFVPIAWCPMPRSRNLPPAGRTGRRSRQLWPWEFGSHLAGTKRKFEGRGLNRAYLCGFAGQDSKLDACCAYCFTTSHTKDLSQDLIRPWPKSVRSANTSFDGPVRFHPDFEGHASWLPRADYLSKVDRLSECPAFAVARILLSDFLENGRFRRDHGQLEQFD